MKKRFICLGLCVAMLLSTTACDGKAGKREFSSSDEKAPSKSFVSAHGNNDNSSEETSEDTSKDFTASNTASTESTTTDVASNDTSTVSYDTELEDVTSDPAEDMQEIVENSELSEHETQLEYAYVSFNEVGMVTKPTGTITDDTVIYNNVTAKELADCMDKECSAFGKKVDRELLYQLLEVHLVDTEVVNDDFEFAYNTMFALAFAYEFSDKDVQLLSLTYPFSESGSRKYEVTLNGENDVIVLNLEDYQLYVENGTTLYKSDMYKESTFGLFLYYTKDLFNLEIGD